VKGRGGGEETAATWSTGGDAGGQDNASATMLLTPLMWRMSLVNSATLDSEWFVVGVHHELSPLQLMTKMPDGQVTRQKLPVKS